MPLPLIPILITIISAGTVVKGAADVLDAADQIELSKKTYEQERKLFDVLDKQYKDKHEMAHYKFSELGKVRLKAAVVLGKAADFIRNAKVKDRDLEEKCKIKPQEMTLWKQSSVSALEIIRGIHSATSSGIATAAGIYGLVGLLGTASTGTAIGTLTGAAATNATLAWLGGGALAAGGGGMALGTFVLGGLVAGPAILVAGFFAKGKAEKIKTEVEKAVADMKVKKAEIGEKLTAFDAIFQRVDEVKSSTISLSLRLEGLVKNCNPFNEEEVFMVAKVAKTTASTLDISILDEKGNLIRG